MTTDPMKKLREAKQKLEAAQRQEQQLQGRHDAAMDRLKTEFGFNTLEAADRHVEELATEVSDLQDKLETGLDELDGLLGRVGK